MLSGISQWYMRWDNLEPYSDSFCWMDFHKLSLTPPHVKGSGFCHKLVFICYNVLPCHLALITAVMRALVLVWPLYGSTECHINALSFIAQILSGICQPLMPQTSVYIDS